MTQTTSLTRYAPQMREADPNGAHRLAKRHWHEHGAIAFTADQIARLPWQDRELIQRIAAKHYGPRNGMSRA